MPIFKREQRANVYQDTLDCIKSGSFKNGGGLEINLELEPLRRGSRYYQKVKKTDEVTDPKSTVIYTQLIDCVQKAYDFGESGALLNMASRFRAGGGVLTGSASQEEEIFRRTTLGYSLYYYDPQNNQTYSYPDHAGQVAAYPIKGDRAALWSPGVMIFKKGPTGYYDYMTQPGHTNVITIPAVQHPELTEGGEAFKEAHGRMWRNKIRTLFRVAKINKKTKLVLGAFGCGAYGNPPALVAELFQEILEEPEFKGAFDEICFAILEDKNSPAGGNYAPFAKVFGHK